MKSLAGIVVSIVVLSCASFSASHADWKENGVPLTRQWGAAGGGAVTPDGDSGAIIAWTACHEGVGCVLVQRVDSFGAVRWGEDGIEVCTATGHECDPEIVSDGLGGAIVAWVDYRNGNSDIYAQRVDASGALQWTINGVALCAAAQDQQEPKLISDGSGGAVVTWSDYRNAMVRDIYAQRVNASGEVQWTADGVALCTDGWTQQYPTIVSDGSEGAIVAWQDSRNGNYDIYAQRVNASGVVQWTANGVALCTAAGYQYSPMIVSDGSGGAIVTWEDKRSGNYDIYAQRVDASGAVQWAADGAALCTAAEYQTDPVIVSDGSGGAIVAWEDLRGGFRDIYAQRVDASGAVQWTLDGIALCAATGDQDNPAIASDGSGGAIVSWADGRVNWDIYAQRVNASGEMQWTVDGVALCVADRWQGNPALISDGSGGAIAVWEDDRSAPYEIYVQRVGGSGAVQWTPDGVVLCAAAGSQIDPVIVSDRVGGAIITWQDSRYDDIYAQRVDALGAVKWATDGVALCEAAGWQTNPVIVSDGSGGAIVAWCDNGDIYAQRVDASGVVQWTADGVALCEAAGWQSEPAIISDGSGGAIVTWMDSRSGNEDIYAQRLNASGVVQWTANGVALCTAMSWQYYPMLVSDGSGGAIVTWMDCRSGSFDIYTQRVDGSGAAQWTVDGVALCTAMESQEHPTIASDGSGGAIVTWYDYRSGNNWDIYAQKMDASGVVQWAADGVALCVAAGLQLDPMIASDGSGGAIVTWRDSRSGLYNEIYAQRLDPSGTVQWTVDGIALCTATGHQEDPMIISDGSGGAIVTWYDTRNGNIDIYAQRVDPSGALEWAANGVALCKAIGSQTGQTMASDGSGGAIVAWGDARCGSLVYAQRVDAAGHVSPETATFLQSYSATLARDGASIRIEWTLSEIDDGARFVISRLAAPGDEFVELEGAIVSRDRLSCSYADESCVPGTRYRYRVAVEVERAARRILFETAEIAIPALPLTLYQSHPNPFNPSTVIRYYLPEAQEVVLDIYDVSGRRVVRLAEGKMERGHHEVRWDGRNGSGAPCSSGVYFSRLRAGKHSLSRKMVIMR